MAAARLHHGRLAALGIILLAASMTALAACDLSTAGAATAGQPTSAAQGSIAHESSPTSPTPGAPDATTVATSGSLGTIAGDVMAGPTCPVESLENPCPPKPVPDRKVSVMTPGGALAATTTTDANGRFTVAVAPGSYVVRVEAGPGMLGLRQTTPGDVTVRAGQIIIVHIELDTGIR
jgi:hypothetical protein